MYKIHSSRWMQIRRQVCIQTHTQQNLLMQGNFRHRWLFTFHRMMNSVGCKHETQWRVILHHLANKYVVKKKRRKIGSNSYRKRFKRRRIHQLLWLQMELPIRLKKQQYSTVHVCDFDMFFKFHYWQHHPRCSPWVNCDKKTVTRRKGIQVSHRVSSRMREDRMQSRQQHSLWGPRRAGRSSRRPETGTS